MGFARFRLYRRLSLALGLVFILSLLPSALALADPAFTSDAFRQKWQRADKPVNDGAANPQRSWLWGPDGFSPANGNTEAYSESPNGIRAVQYFDKARMELNNPAAGAVTNGLLVRELISGKQAIGDAAFTQRRAADDIPVAGDPSGNNGPVYASFAKLATLNNDNPASDRTGQAVGDTIDKAGMVGSNAELGGKAKYAYFDQSLKHNVPDVFWQFMNQRGTVYQNGGLVANQPVLSDNQAAPWVDAMGLPITEAYWSKVTVGGEVKDVLIQGFERRVLTYTPTNPPAFQVEMGNVGRHYFTWRYTTKYDQTAPPASTPTPTPTPAPTQPPAPAPAGCDSLPANTGSAFPFVKCGPAGMEVVLAMAATAGDTVQVSVTRPDNSTDGYTQTVRSDGNFITSYDTTRNSPQGKWIFNFKAQNSKKEGTAYFWLDKPVTKPTIIVYPNPSRLDQDITILVVGFESEELVKLAFTSPAPNAPVYGTTRLTNTGGGFTALLKLRTFYPEKYLVPGVWILGAAAENDKNRIAFTTFTVTK